MGETTIAVGVIVINEGKGTIVLETHRPNVKVYVSPSMSVNTGKLNN